MSKIGTLSLTGASGAKYEFNVYSFDTEFNSISTVYYVSKRTVGQNGTGSHSKIYIGETEERQSKRMLFCNETDTGSKFARHENEQTSDMVLNPGKRFERNNYTGVDR
ncbi:MAG: hypothetical protein U9O95_00920 [Candidatus Marinimicrobia bacterium]|nr:hypothetical protein [Candidatus Neomarinimicrobiota bacterium]